MSQQVLNASLCLLSYFLHVLWKLTCFIFTNEWQVDFELTEKFGVTTGDAQKLQWEHKICDYKFFSKEIRAIRYDTLAPGRRSFKPLQMTRQRYLLTTLRSKIGPVIFLIRDKSVQEPLHLLLKVLVPPPLRSISSTKSMRQLLSFLLVAHYHSTRTLMLGPG